MCAREMEICLASEWVFGDSTIIERRGKKLGASKLICFLRRPTLSQKKQQKRASVSASIIAKKSSIARAARQWDQRIRKVTSKK